MRNNINKPKIPSPGITSAFITAQRRHSEETRVLGLIHRFTELLPHKPTVKEVCEHLVRVMIEETDFENCSVVLRAANSAYYGFCGKVTTVSRAVVAIGFHEVQNICLCALLMQHFHSEAVNQKEQMQLWQHSFATGGLARSIAQLRPWIQTEESYVLGLLHDLGRMVLMFYFLDDYHQIHKLATESSVSFYVAEERHGMPHTLIGKWLAIKWHLPTVYQIVMEYHHVPLSAPQSQKEVSLIYLADVLAYAEDIANQPNQDYVNECCDQLYISKDEWQYLGEKAIAIRNESVNMWNMLKPA